MPLPRKSIATAGLAIMGALSLSACATEGYVDKHIATVNDRISALESRVQQVDGTAQQANSTAQAAASAAQQANQRLDALTARVDAVEQQLASRRPRKLISSPRSSSQRRTFGLRGQWQVGFEKVSSGQCVTARRPY